MKKILNFSVLPLLVLSMVLFAGCGKDEFRLKGITFKEADIMGTSILALAHPATDVKEANVVSLLYKTNAQGILEEVEYTIEVKAESDSVARVVNARVRLSIREMIPFGEKWLWLKECRYICPTIDEIENDDLRREVADLLSREDFTRHFLVRLTDGALFEWSIGIPYGGRDFDVNTALHFRGRCEPYGEDLISVQNTQVMYRLKDLGNTLEVSTVTPTNIYADNVFPLKDGIHIGSELNYGGGSEPYIINPNTLQIIPIQLSPEMIPDGWEYPSSEGIVCIDGQLYIPVVVSKHVDWVGTKRRLSFCRVHLADGAATANEEVAALELPEDSDYPTMCDMGNTGLAEPLVYGTVFSFISGDTWSDYKIFTFEPERHSLSYRPLPDHYPSSATDYRDGVGYVVERSTDIPIVYWRCDLAKEAAEQVPIVWGDDLQTYLSQMVLSSLVLEYNMSSDVLLGHCMLLDGRKVSFHADVEGSDRGRMHLLLEGEQTAGVVVTNMVRLN